MRAAVFKRNLGRMVIETVERPTLQANDLLIRVARTGICGSELHATAQLAHRIGPDSIMGHELCGEVVAIGAAVQGFQVGDRVAPMPYEGCGQCAACLAGTPQFCPLGRFGRISGYCQYTCADANSCVRLPDGLSDDAGALVEPLAVGLQGLRKAALSVGDRVLITGAGPIGLAAAFWARRLGASQIAMLASSTRRQALAQAIGVDHFIALSEVEQPQQAVQQALGAAPEVVIEAVGLPGAINEAIRQVRPTGTVVSLGLCWQDDTISPVTATMKEVRLLFSLCYSRADFAYCAQVLAQEPHTPLLQMITATIPLDDLPDTFEALRQPSAHCKVLVNPWASSDSPTR